MNTVGQFHLMEVDKQPKRDIQQFHVAQELRFVDGQNLLHRLCFDQHIESQRLLSRETLVFNHHEFLAHACQPAQFKLSRQTPFVDGFDQAGSFVAVHFNGPSDNRLGQP